MLYLFVGLKIPILMLGAIVWWAVRQTPDPIEPEGGDGGGRRVRPHEPPKLPRAPPSPPSGSMGSGVWRTAHHTIAPSMRMGIFSPTNR